MRKSKFLTMYSPVSLWLYTSLVFLKTTPTYLKYLTRSTLRKEVHPLHHFTTEAEEAGALSMVGDSAFCLERSGSTELGPAAELTRKPHSQWPSILRVQLLSESLHSLIKQGRQLGTTCVNPALMWGTHTQTLVFVFVFVFVLL